MVSTCDGIDNDCDNQIDDNPVGGQLYLQCRWRWDCGATTIQSWCCEWCIFANGDCDDLDPAFRFAKMIRLSLV